MVTYLTLYAAVFSFILKISTIRFENPARFRGILAWEGAPLCLALSLPSLPTRCLLSPSFQACLYLPVIASETPKTRAASSIITVTTRHAHISFSLSTLSCFQDAFSISHVRPVTTISVCLITVASPHSCTTLSACALCSTVRLQLPNLTTDPCSAIPIVLQTRRGTAS